MKKFFIPLVMMCFGIISTKAEITDVSSIDNVVYLPPVTASAGTQCVLSIQMKNVVAITGFEFYMQLPDGITFSTDEDNFLLTSLSEARTTSKKTTFFEGTVNEANLLHVLCSTTKEDPATNQLYTFSGTDGEVCTVTIDIPSNYEVGTYPLVLSEIVLTEPDTEKFYETARVETTLTIEESDGRIHFDENASSLPIYTAGEKGDVTMKRTIKSNEWSTIVLPFTLTMDKAKAVFGEDVHLAEFSGFEADYGDDDENVTPLAIIINFTTYTMSARKPLTGGKPFLIKTSQDVTTIEANDVTLVSTVTPVEKKDEWETSGTFTGTLVKSTVPADCLFLSDNKFWYSVGATNIKAFRGWFDLGAVLGKETDFGVKQFLFYLDDEPTRIAEMITDQESGYIYDLSGRKVNSPSQRGVYIVNGKKVLK